MKKKSLEVDMIAGSQLRDTQGETLSIEGADISDLEAGKGRLNDNHGKGFFNSIGAVTGAKKIFKKEDCENDRHEYYWNKIKSPFIYVKGYLYDDEEHPNAKAAAAILRNIHKNDSPLQLKASVEGGVVARGISDSTLLARTKIHSVALTFTPANNNTLVEPISLNKGIYDPTEDKRLIESVMHLAQRNVPSFRHITRDASAQKIKDNLDKINDMTNKLGVPLDIQITKDNILHKAIEHKIKENVEKIHDLIIGEEPVDKGIKDIGFAASMGAALAGMGGITDAEAASKMPKSKIEQIRPLDYGVIRNNDPRPHIEMFNKIKNENPILGAIGLKETSGGIKHDDHSVISEKKDLNYGHTAGGIWGMMPYEAATTIRRDPELAKKYPNLAKEAANEKSPNFNHLMFTNSFNTDPQIAADFAESAIKKRTEIFSDIYSVFHSWLNGLGGPKAYKDKHGAKALKNHEYVKFCKKQYDEIVKQNMQSKIKQKRDQGYAKIKESLDTMLNNPSFRAPSSIDKEPLLRALTAGYGGSGAPTNMTSGAVLQSESLDNSLKHITCDNCGKEQVYSKYQVKCRKCNTNFSLNKLHDILS